MSLKRSILRYVSTGYRGSIFEPNWRTCYPDCGFVVRSQSNVVRETPLTQFEALPLVRMTSVSKNRILRHKSINFATGFSLASLKEERSDRETLKGKYIQNFTGSRNRQDGK